MRPLPSDRIDTAFAFWTVKPGLGEIRPEPPIPPLASSPYEDPVQVRARYSGISRGTESLVFHGRMPASEYQRMRAPFQGGELPGPVKYGYASVGVVEAGPASLIGRHVFVLYPHQTRYVVPAAAVHLIPDDVPPRRAVLAANLETAINGVWDAEVKVGDHVVVIGAGAVGCLTARVAVRIPGCRVTLVDVNTARARLAGALGVAFATPDDAPTGADVVIHASGSPSGLNLALRLAGDEATIVELSWYGDTVVPVELGAAFHARRLTIRSSQVGRVPPAQRARWSTARRMRVALSLLADPALDAVITGETDFADLPTVVPSLTGEAGDTICHLVRYPSTP